MRIHRGRVKVGSERPDQEQVSARRQPKQSEPTELPLQLIAGRLLDQTNASVESALEWLLNWSCDTFLHFIGRIWIWPRFSADSLPVSCGNSITWRSLGRITRAFSSVRLWVGHARASGKAARVCCGRQTTNDTHSPLPQLNTPDFCLALLSHSARQTGDWLATGATRRQSRDREIRRATIEGLFFFFSFSTRSRHSSCEFGLVLLARQPQRR